MSLKISRFGHWKKPTQATRIEGLGITEVYICVRPTKDEGGFSEQAHSMYENLFQVLSEHGADPGNVITEKVFFSDVDRQFRDLIQIRQHWYGSSVPTADDFPATIFLHQPPCHPARLCELQAYVLFPTQNEEIKIRTLDGTPGLASGKMVDYRGIRHLYLTNLTADRKTDNLSFASQAEDMFDRARLLLAREGLSMQDVIRTWIYLNNIERDYADLNLVRTKFFQEHGVTRLPASTGIQGATYPKERSCAMDLHALKTERGVQIEVICAPVMNEALKYGSSFSRGINVIREDRIITYVSGTASIDNQGNVVHVGDVEGQINRMLRNVEELLAAQNITPNDIITLITYLKDPKFLDPFWKIYEEHSFPKDAPNTVCTADICRPEWLCEIEVIAVVPQTRHCQKSNR